MFNYELKTIISICEFADKGIEYIEQCYHPSIYSSDSIIADALMHYNLYSLFCECIDYVMDLRGIARVEGDLYE